LPAKQEHIRELCERAVTTESDDELQEILSELRILGNVLAFVGAEKL